MKEMRKQHLQFGAYVYVINNSGIITKLETRPAKRCTVISSKSDKLKDP
jgi:hypothetical protein